MMSEVFRGKMSNVKAMPGYLFHGIFAVLALWLVLKALGS
jgi:hypothetical protein